MLSPKPDPRALAAATYDNFRVAIERHVGGDRALAEDLLQDSLLRFLRKRDDVREPEASVGYLWRIIRNRIHDHHRRQARAGRAPVSPEASADHRGAAPTEMIDEPGAEPPPRLDDFLPRALAALPAPSRDILTAVELGGQSQVAYARERGLKYSTAKSRLVRARQLLRTVITDCCHVETDAYGQLLAVVPRRRVCCDDVTTVGDGIS